mmetsp:Transcript_25351/g.22391  ORF Transcript_25351/g.22391 Transcript_25351/m.22391 type:complete len:139 (-) Transcript_25351:646-1062(-)
MSTHKISIKPSQKLCPEIHSQKPDDLTILKLISKAKFTVFLAHSEEEDNYYAMKIFPINRKDSINPLYLCEKSTAGLKHKNIIVPRYTEDRMNIRSLDGFKFQASVTYMEYAPYGTLYDLIKVKKVVLNDLLVRTFFH